MPFLIYKRKTSGPNVCFEPVQSLKLAGTAGLIARYVQTLGATESGSWQMEPGALLKLAGYEAKDLAVLFDANRRDAKNVCLYALNRIQGNSRDTSTQLALDFTVLAGKEVGGEPLETGKRFEAPVAEKPKGFVETLALTGGPSGGDWKWAESAMNLGATVV